MYAQRGDLVNLLIGDAENTESFSSVGGLRVTQLEVFNNPLDNTTLGDGAWRQLQSGSGIRFASVSGEGMFTNTTSEAQIQALSFSGVSNNYKLQFGNGDELSGAFIIGAYEKSGEHTSEETYLIRLESAGTLHYTQAV